MPQKPESHGTVTKAHHSHEVIRTWQLVCTAGRNSWTLTSNRTLLALCKQLKLEARYNHEAIILGCSKQTTIAGHLELCTIISTDTRCTWISLLWSNQALTTLSGPAVKEQHKLLSTIKDWDRLHPRHFGAVLARLLCSARITNENGFQFCGSPTPRVSNDVTFSHAHTLC